MAICEQKSGVLQVSHIGKNYLAQSGYSGKAKKLGFGVKGRHFLCHSADCSCVT